MELGSKLDNIVQNECSLEPAVFQNFYFLLWSLSELKTLGIIEETEETVRLAIKCLGRDPTVELNICDNVTFSEESSQVSRKSSQHILSVVEAVLEVYGRFTRLRPGVDGEVTLLQQPDHGETLRFK